MENELMGQFNGHLRDVMFINIDEIDLKLRANLLSVSKLWLRGKQWMLMENMKNNSLFQITLNILQLLTQNVRLWLVKMTDELVLYPVA